MARRSYRQICGVSRALDLLGERWTLLVIRELMLGPKRFGALKDALPGLSANLLSARMKALVDAGLVEHTDLPAPASVPAYRLSERGEALRPTMESLAVWGYELLEPEREHALGWATRGSWLALTLAAAAGPGSFRDVGPAVVNCDVGGERFVIRSDGERAHVRHGAAEDPDGVLSTDLDTFYGLTQGRGAAEDPKVGKVLEALSGRR